MKLPKILVAILLSLPLIPVLVLSNGSINDPISSKEMSLLIPLMLELFGFFAVYKFVKGHHHKFSKDERRSLMVLACGAFWILGLPLVLLAPSIPDLGYPVWILYLTILYAFINLVINTRRISDSSASINRFFFKRYVIPGGLAALLMLLGFRIFMINLNGVAVYYLIKNFIGAFDFKKTNDDPIKTNPL